MLPFHRQENQGFEELSRTRKVTQEIQQRVSSTLVPSGWGSLGARLSPPPCPRREESFYRRGLEEEMTLNLPFVGVLLISRSGQDPKLSPGKPQLGTMVMGAGRVEGRV